MTVVEIRDMIAEVDPNARHYENPHDGTNYTVWMEYERTGLMADDESGKGWKFQIDRYTKDEFDLIADALELTLDTNDAITFTHMVEYEQESGYIRHIFDCVGC